MANRRFLAITLGTLGLLGAPAMGAHAATRAASHEAAETSEGANEREDADDQQGGDEHDEGDQEEDEIAFSAAPQAVQDGIKRLTATPPAQLDKEVKDGATVYEAEWKEGGRKQSATVAESGAVVELEKETARDDLPRAVESVIGKAYPGATIQRVEAVHEGGQESPTYYEVKVHDKSGTKEVKVRPNGEPFAR
jgi:hypothetical protein